MGPVLTRGYGDMYGLGFLKSTPANMLVVVMLTGHLFRKSPLCEKIWNVILGHGPSARNM